MRLALSLIVTTAAIAFAAPAMAQGNGPVTYRGSIEPCHTGQTFALQLRAGERYTISANSEAFDPVLKIFRRGASEVLAQDDDSGEGNNSRLSFSPSEPGDYVACVTPFSDNGGGAFTVTVEPAGPMPALTATRPTGTENQVWQLYDGTLAQGDGEDDGKKYDDYLINVPAGNRVMISAEASAFDPMVKVYRADQRGGEPVASDDDSGGGLNSFLTYTPDEGGSFVVRVTSFAADGSGAYRLRVSTQPVPRAAPQPEGGE